MSSTLTLVALPPADLVAPLVALSSSISTRMPSHYRLGDDALPHVTIVQWAESEEEALLGALDGRLVSTGEVVLAGLTLLPGFDGDVWAEVQALSSAWLRTTQVAALEATADLPWPVMNGTGDRFRPHVTVGLTYACNTIGLEDDLQPDLLRSAKGLWRLGVGRSGPNYTLESLIVDLGIEAP